MAGVQGGHCLRMGALLGVRPIQNPAYMYPDIGGHLTDPRTGSGAPRPPGGRKASHPQSGRKPRVQMGGLPAGHPLRGRLTVLTMRPLGY